MSNSFSDYKKLLSIFTYEEQVNKLNQKIYEVLYKKQDGNMLDTRYELIKELKQLKNNVINRFYLIHILIKIHTIYIKWMYH